MAVQETRRPFNRNLKKIIHYEYLTFYDIFLYINALYFYSNVSLPSNSMMHGIQWRILLKGMYIPMGILYIM